MAARGFRKMIDKNDSQVYALDVCSDLIRETNGYACIRLWKREITIYSSLMRAVPLFERKKKKKIA